MEVRDNSISIVLFLSRQVLNLALKERSSLKPVSEFQDFNIFLLLGLACSSPSLIMSQ